MSCPLARTGARAVVGEGPDDALVLFVGQAPGAEEDRTGRPFVGRAGRFLCQTLAGVGLRREDVFLTSVEKYFPPGNRRPTRAEIDACKPILLRQIEAVDPAIVVLLGRVAEEALAGEPVLEGREVLRTTHPAAAMRFPWLRRRFERDLEAVARAARRHARRRARRGGGRRRSGATATGGTRARRARDSTSHTSTRTKRARR